MTYESFALLSIAVITAAAGVAGLLALYRRNDTGVRWDRANQILNERRRERDQRLRELLDECPIRRRPTIIDQQGRIVR